MTLIVTFRLSLSDDSFETRPKRFSTVFDLAPPTESIEDVTEEERHALVKVCQPVDCYNRSV